MNKEIYDQKVWSEILSNGETISFAFSIGSRYIKFRAIFWGIIGFFMFLCPAVVFLTLGIWFMSIVFMIIFALIVWYPLFYIPRANLYALTNKRVLVRKGWLSTTMQSVDYHNITDVAVKQDFLSKQMLKTGTIVINTAGHLTNQIVLRDVEAPYEIKKKVDHLKAQ